MIAQRLAHLILLLLIPVSAWSVHVLRQSRAIRKTLASEQSSWNALQIRQKNLQSQIDALQVNEQRELDCARLMAEAQRLSTSIGGEKQTQQTLLHKLEELSAIVRAQSVGIALGEVELEGQPPLQHAKITKIQSSGLTIQHDGGNLTISREQCPKGLKKRLWPTDP